MINQSLKDVVISYLDNMFKEPGRVGLYIGDVYDIPDNSTPEKRIFLVKRENQLRDYISTITLDSSKKYHELTIGAEEDYLAMHFAPGILKMQIQPYQVTGEEFEVPQLIDKSDWVSPEPLVLLAKGNYSPQREILESATSLFEKTGEKIPLIFPELISFLSRS